MQNLRSRIEATVPVVRMGEVVQVTGLVIESIGPNVSLGDICEIIGKDPSIERLT
jgi:flagellar biosynthesis/type III secretory pathway ATPase